MGSQFPDPTLSLYTLRWKVDSQPLDRREVSPWSSWRKGGSSASYSNNVPQLPVRTLEDLGVSAPLELKNGEGNGNPLQCCCLENPRDGGAWWAVIYGVAQSRTQLKRLSSSSSRAKEMSHLRAPCLNNICSVLQKTTSKIPSIYKALTLKSLPLFFHMSLEHTWEVGKRQNSLYKWQW